MFLNVTLREANCSSPPTLDKNCSLQSVQKDYTQAALSCDFNLPQKQFVTLSSGALTHPKASTNTTGNTNTHTQEPSRLREPYPDLWFPVKGVLFATIQQHHWCPLVNFALSPPGSEEPCVVGEKREEWREQRSEATVCARLLNHCVHMKAGIVSVFLYVCVCDPLQYMCT